MTPDSIGWRIASWSATVAALHASEHSPARGGAFFAVAVRWLAARGARWSAASAGVPLPPDTRHRAVPAGRHRRHHAAHIRREAGGEVGPAGDRGQPPRRGGQHRRGAGLPGGARRLHAALGAAAAARHQPEPVPEARLRSRAVRRRWAIMGAVPNVLLVQSEGAGGERPGADRPREGAIPTSSTTRPRATARPRISPRRCSRRWPAG